MEAARLSEALVPTYNTTVFPIPKEVTFTDPDIITLNMTCIFSKKYFLLGVFTRAYLSHV